MNYKWITAAIAGGGVLTVSGPVKGHRMVRAEMYWAEDEDRITGTASLSVLGALDNLEALLVEVNEGVTE